MKNQFLLCSSALIILVALLPGCTDNIPVGNPDSSAYSLSAEDNEGIREAAGNVLFRLPEPKNKISKVSQTRRVSPAESTQFHCLLAYVSRGNATVSFDVKFSIPAGAVSDTATVTVTLDTLLTTITFEPSGLQFLKPAQIDVTLKNLDPITMGTIVGFLYVNPNGTYGLQEYEKLSVDPSKGFISMKRGKITHFSQYGFGRLTECENGK